MNTTDHEKSALVGASSTALARTGSQALVRRGLRELQIAEQKDRTPLDRLCGLGKRLTEKLNAAGVTTFEALADMTPEQLEAIEGIRAKDAEEICFVVCSYFATRAPGALATAVEEWNEKQVENRARLLFCLDHQCSHDECPDVPHLDFTLVPLKNANLPAQSSTPEEPAGQQESEFEIKPSIDLVGDDKWGLRGRERCSCGKALEFDEDWYCRECGLKLEYFVVFDASGGYLIHDSQMPIVTEPDGRTYWQTPDGSLYGPFPRKEAEAVLATKTRSEVVRQARGYPPLSPRL